MSGSERLHRTPLIITVTQWRTEQEGVLAALTAEINRLLNGRSNGCFEIVLDGPMSEEEAHE